MVFLGGVAVSYERGTPVISDQKTEWCERAGGGGGDAMEEDMEDSGPMAVCPHPVERTWNKKKVEARFWPWLEPVSVQTSKPRLI